MTDLTMAEATAIWRDEQARDIATNDVLMLTVAATQRQKYVYRLTRRHSDGSMDASGVYARLIGDYSRPSTARAAADRHEGDSDKRPTRVWNSHRGYWWRYSRIGVYIYEVCRLDATTHDEVMV